MSANRRSTIICMTFSASGLALNLLWCTLMGHTPGFMLSSLGLGEVVNARTFWLLGIALISLLFVLLPRQIADRERRLAYLMPVLSAGGTACFALSFNQSLFDPALLATAGLTVAGLGYVWFASRFVLLLVKAEGFKTVVWCIVAAFPLRQLVSLGLDGLFDASQQVVVAIALPFLSALFLELARICARKSADAKHALGPVASSPTRQPIDKASGIRSVRQTQSTHDMVIILIIVGILLAMVRIFGPSGIWGDSNTVYFESLGRIPAILVLTLCLAVFAWLALILMAKKPASIRFQLPILVVIAGLFVVVIRSQVGESPSPLLDSIVQANDPFAHLLLWSAIAAAATMLDMPENRIIGIPGLVYSVSSIVWIVFLRGSAVIETTIILVVVALVMNRSWFSHFGQRSVADPEDSNHLAIENSAARLSQSIAERCKEVATEYKLSPRETEVFMLLAQGRTCSFIQNELVLAESTVKTHMSHIYTKMSVNGRQEMMDLVFGEQRHQSK